MGNSVSHCEEAVAMAIEDRGENTNKDIVVAAAGAESVPVEAEEPQVEAEPEREIVVDTAPIDPRFPATNQARHCFVKYNEAHKCFADRGEDDDACKKLARDYRAICPVEWLEKWNEAREDGTWWGKW